MQKNLKEFLQNSFKEFQNNYIFENITYDRFRIIAQSIALAIKDTNTQNIAIIGEKSLQLYAGIVGIVFANKTFVPKSLSYPKERVKYILETADIKEVLVCDEAVDIIKNYDLNIKSIFIKDISITNKQTIENLNTKSNNYLYILFTSGTTAKPKAIPISHKNFISNIS